MECREIGEITRAIEATQVGAPSAVAGELEAVSRNLPTQKLRRLLRGDLDTIVLKALRKDLERGRAMCGGHPPLP